jgi:hypothetical protein
MSAIQRMNDLIRDLAGYVKGVASVELFGGDDESLRGRLAIDHIVPLAYFQGDEYPVRLSIRVKHTLNGKQVVRNYYASTTVTAAQLVQGSSNWSFFLQPKAVTLVSGVKTLLGTLTDPTIESIDKSNQKSLEPEYRRFIVV